MSQQVHDHEVGMAVAADNVYPYRVGIVGGLIAGAVMTVAMALWGLWSGNGIWYPVNMIAATILRPMQAMSDAELRQFMPLAAVVGTAAHIAVSTALGFLFDLVLPTLPGSALLWGIVIGLLLWAGANFAVLPLINPRMTEMTNQPTFLLANVAYSVVLGLWVSRAEKLDLSPDPETLLQPR